MFATLSLAVCGAVRAEVLAGARSATDRNKLISLLDSVAQIPIPDSIWDTVGDNLQTLQASGITVPFPDVVLATIAISNACEFWTRDAHFALVQRALPALKLFQEPP